MYNSTNVITQFAAQAIQIGTIISAVVVAVLATAVALMGLGFGFERLRLYIYNHGGAFRGFGTPPYKGYKWYRSQKWNAEHTA